MFLSGSCPGTSAGEKARETRGSQGNTMQNRVHRIPVTPLSSFPIQLPRGWRGWDERAFHGMKSQESYTIASVSETTANGV